MYSNITCLDRGCYEKYFITKKFTQFKTPHTLKIDVFEILDNKNIGKLFSKFSPPYFTLTC